MPAEMGVLVSARDGRTEFSHLADDGGAMDGTDGSGKRARERRRSGFVSGPIGHAKGGVVLGEDELPMLPPLPAHLLAIGVGGRGSALPRPHAAQGALSSTAGGSRRTFGLDADFVLPGTRAASDDDNDDDDDADTDDDELARRPDPVSYFRRHFRAYAHAQRAHEVWADERAEIAARSKAVDALHRRRSEEWHRRELRREMRRAGVLSRGGGGGGGGGEDEDGGSSDSEDEDEAEEQAEINGGDDSIDGSDGASDDHASDHVRLTASALRAAARGRSSNSTTITTSTGTDAIHSARLSLARLVARSLNHTRLRCALTVWMDAYSLARESKARRLNFENNHQLYPDNTNQNS